MRIFVATSRAVISIQTGAIENTEDTAKAEGTRQHLVDTFVPGLGTVRDCLGCACLIAGGPTRCIRCASEAPQ